MGDVQYSAAGAHELADLIESRREEIITQYADALAATGSAIARDPVSRNQARTNAGQILADVTESLRRGSVHVDEAYRLIAWDIGTTRAAARVHPGESAHASSLFFETVLTAAARLLESVEDRLSLLSAVALTLERSIRDRGSAALAGYTSFLLNEVHEAQVGERRRIARELHDRIGHCMSVAHQQLELYEIYRRQQDRQHAAGKIAAVQRAVREAMENLRAITSDLYTMETLKSLEKALAGYLDQAEPDGVKVHLKINGDENWAGPQVLDECFLILREAARNALRHAAASLVVINVDITPYEIRGSVQDNGRGFDPGAARSGGGVGISAMRERSRLLGGAVQIASAAGKGTRIGFTVPLREQTARGRG